MGRIISAKALRPTPDAIENILAFTKPKNAKEVEKSLELVNWIRQFVPHLSTLIAPISQLKSPRVKFDWTDEHDLAFERIQKAAKDSQFLHFPDYRKPFILESDASNIGIGLRCYKNKMVR